MGEKGPELSHDPGAVAEQIQMLHAEILRKPAMKDVYEAKIKELRTHLTGLTVAEERKKKGL